MALPIGSVLDGKFKIVQVLGEGGMGTVYKVELVGKPGYYRAIKELLISPNTSPEDRKSAIERFDKEIDLLFNLKHPRIPSLLLNFQERGNYYFVMEFVPGRSLDRMLEDKKGPLPEEDVIKWMMQVCEALSYIHSRHPPIILRDLKPGNIMVTPGGDVQLIDFGIARRFDPNKRTNTENLGTISYASPEHLGSITAPGQRRTAQNSTPVQTDARSDIYSLGATIYHLLTNYEPDPIQTPRAGSMLSKNPRLHTMRIGNTTVCPIEQVVIKAMQQNPAQRFQNADAMRVALSHCLPNNAPPATVHIPAISPNATIIVPANGLICPKCGFQNRPGAKFCKRDGQPLLQGATVVPPQARIQAQAVSRAPIKARPVSQPPVQARPTPIRARPVTSSNGSNGNAPAATINDPANDPATTFRLGLSHLNAQRYPEAINAFQLARRQGYSPYDVLFNLGRAYRQYAQEMKGKNKKLFAENMKLAAEQFEQATRYKPDAQEAYFQLGLSYRDLALYAQASNAFKKTLHLHPNEAAAYFQLGIVAMEQGYNRDAEDYFRKCLSINPAHTLSLVELGRLYSENRQHSKAISTLAQATQQDPTLAEAWYVLGRAHMKINQWSPALSAFQRAQQLTPQISEIYSGMAACYLKMRKKSEARQMVREALQRDSNNAEANRLQKQV